MFTQEQVEQALHDGALWVHMLDNRWWRSRRNGKTRTWKTRPGEFRIPLKFGFYGYGQITHNQQDGYVISETDPNVKPTKAREFNSAAFAMDSGHA